MGVAFLGLQPVRKVASYARPRDFESRRWLVFEPDGALRCRAETPAGVEVYEAGADYVLGKHRDEAMVERVVVYRYEIDSVQ